MGELPGRAKVVILGGGIAGLSCLDGLVCDFDSSSPQFASVTLVSNSRLIKRVRNYTLSGRNLSRFDVAQDDIADLRDGDTFPSNLAFKFVIGQVKSIDVLKKSISIAKLSGEGSTDGFICLDYDILCICSGSKPKKLTFPSRANCHELENRLIIIRDFTTVSSLQQKLKNCRKLAIVGNGGIGLELVSKITGCDKIWIIKDETIGSIFFDSGASKFLLDHQRDEQDTPVDGSGITRSAYTVSQTIDTEQQPMGHFGPSLGPDWLSNLNLIGQSKGHSLRIIYQDEVDDIMVETSKEAGPVCLRTKKGQVIYCDLVALAIGVDPDVPESVNGQFEISEVDGGILIDDQMRSSIEDIYAAGDVVSCERWPKNDQWFQMRLWTQARQMGFYAGRCIALHLAGSDPSLYFDFDCFTHCTKFFGHKVTLLGRFNAQNLSEEEARCTEVIARVIKGKEYTKLILMNNRVIGAVMIGDSGLEETIENLIHDQIDVSRQKDRLLDGSIDIEDYFD